MRLCFRFNRAHRCLQLTEHLGPHKRLGFLVSNGVIPFLGGLDNISNTLVTLNDVMDLKAFEGVLFLFEAASISLKVGETKSTVFGFHNRFDGFEIYFQLCLPTLQGQNVGVVAFLGEL